MRTGYRRRISYFYCVESIELVAEIGHFAVIVAFMLAIAQSIIPMLGAQYQDPKFMAFGASAASGQFGFIILAFACLTYGFVTSDFSVALVANHSNLAMPLIYKVSAVWGNHEGSMLLWVMILALFGYFVAIYGQNLPAPLKARVLAIQGMIGTGFLAFVLFTSNPFDRLSVIPADGQALNPLLQDFGLAIHPPFLYLGYVGFSMAFSFSVAALIEGRIDASWARWVRPWVLAAWCFLTIGITLGSYWAYYELGWGGWWFWDPVENASFMPWLVGTALLHSALVMERRQALVNWTILLGILAFSLSLVGTFLVRSGVLTSVHAFTQDPDRGVFVLALLVLATGGALTLYALRIPTLKYGAPFSPVSREGALVLNNALLMTATGTVFLGTFYPLIISAIGDDKISVGPPFYNLTFVPIMVPLLIVMAIGPMLKWKRCNIKKAFTKLRVALGITLLAVLTIVLLTWGRHVAAALGLGLAVWLVAGSIAVLAHRIRLGRVPIAKTLQLARTTPRAVYGLVFAHAGMGIAVAGIAAMTAWSQEEFQALGVSDHLQVGSYQVTLKDISRAKGPNYEALRATLDITYNDKPVATLFPEKRHYSIRNFQTTEAGIHTNFFSNIYLALGERNDAGKWTVRAYYHPLAPWIWFGPMIMAFGGLISLSDRRLRVGAPQRARLKPKREIALAPAE